MNVIAALLIVVAAPDSTGIVVAMDGSDVTCIGTGVVVGRDSGSAIICTNHHIVAGSESFVFFAGEKSYVCSKTVSDNIGDLALLTTNDKGQLHPVIMAECVPGPASFGGYGGDAGWLRQKGRLEVHAQKSGYNAVCIVGASARPGDSGGPIYQNGRVVGILSHRGTKRKITWGAKTFRINKLITALKLGVAK